jgi:hypothetical protein
MHYLLVSQSDPLIEHFARHPDGGWRYEAVSGLAASVALEAIGCVLRLGDVYDRVGFEEAAEAAEDVGGPG